MTLDDDRERRLHEVLGEYFEAAGTGTEPDRGEWIARHPELAGELAEFFDEQDRVHALTRMISGRDDPAASLGDFGDYVLVREIARGGMGVVFEARQKGLNRPVAIKMILDGARASDAELRRFQVEAEAAAGLDHPRIVPIHEVGQHAGQPYFSMKLMPGGTLADRLGDFLDDPKAAASTVATIALAVDHAHRRGVLHRDLKPSNILLDTEGRPHVADFGLARKIEGPDDITRTGALLGSPPYMAPEQAAGRKGAISTATDVYGLGAILYALLTGAAPFRGGSALETMERVRDQAPEPPSRSNPKVDRDLETICLKCLEKDPGRRYASAGALAEDLERWRSGEPIAARPVGPAERAWRWCRRKPLPALSAALAALLVVVTIVGLLAIVRAQAEQLSEHNRAESHNFWFVHGMIEPLKKLADPDLGANPNFAALRGEILSVAIQAHSGLASSLSDAPSDRIKKVDIFIHIALLQTAAGEHPRAWEAYREAIRIAESLAVDAPKNIDTWDRVGQAHSHLGMDLWLHERAAEALPHLRAASNAFRRGTELGPKDLYTIQHDAWFLVFCPDERFRDPQRALSLARRVAGITPGYESRNPNFLSGIRPLFTLAISSYRAGDLKAARDAVEKSMALRSGGDAYDWFLLALLHARQGDRVAARKRYEQADLWTRRNRYGDFELHFLRAEAEAAIR